MDSISESTDETVIDVIRKFLEETQKIKYFTKKIAKNTIERKFPLM